MEKLEEAKELLKEIISHDVWKDNTAYVKCKEALQKLEEIQIGKY